MIQQHSTLLGSILGPIPPKTAVPNHNCSCKNNTQAIKELQADKDKLKDKIKYLKTMIQTIKLKSINQCSCENNTQEIKELKFKKEDLENQIEHVKLTINSLVQAFNNLTNEEPELSS